MYKVSEAAEVDIATQTGAAYIRIARLQHRMSVMDSMENSALACAVRAEKKGHGLHVDFNPWADTLEVLDGDGMDGHKLLSPTKINC